MSWNEKLKELRGNKTIEQITEDLNLNPNVYEAYERGERMPFPSVKELIAKYYNISVADIWGK